MHGDKMTTDSAKQSDAASEETVTSSVSKDVVSDETKDSSPPPRLHSGGVDGHSPTQEQTESRRLPLSPDRRSSRYSQALEEDDLPEHLFSEAFQENIGKPGRKALHAFFYPTRRQSASVPFTNPTGPDPPETVDTSSHETQNAKAPPTATNSQRDPSFPTTDNTTPPPGRQPLDPLTSRQPPTPPSQPPTSQKPPPPPSQQPSQLPIEEDPDLLEQERQDREYVERFWTAYDDFLILSLFTQFGIICRLAAAYWFRVFDAVFRNDSALFTVLPLNCLSCFVMGLLSSGESLMQIISTRFTPPRLQQEIYRESATEDFEDFSNDRFDDNDRMRSRRRNRTRQRRQPNPTRSWQPAQLNLQDELREVQLLALERRIRASSCLFLFPVKKEDVDVVENYFGDGFKSRKSEHSQEEEKREEEYCASSDDGFSFDEHDLYLDEECEFDDLASSEEEELDDLGGDDVIRRTGNYDDPPAAATSAPNTPSAIPPVTVNLQAKLLQTPSPANAPQAQLTEDDSKPSAAISDVERQDLPPEAPEGGRTHAATNPRLRNRQYGQINGGNVVDYGNAEHPDLDLMISNVATGVAEKVSRISRVSLADGWDVGTSPEEKCEDLMLGLRDGLCGALSSFSSWISSMVVLLKGGQIGEAFVGLGLGIQLPIVAYRFGQNVAVYIFIWRCRRETRRDERRGYGIRLSTDDLSDDDRSNESLHSGDTLNSTPRHKRTKGRRTVQEEESETPSVRAIITALFMMMFVAQVTSLFFFYEPEDRLLALSLLFSPLGVLTRWRLSKFNSWRPNFPIGTFACNVAACALAGTLGTILAGNPGPRERIVLVSVIAGFGGTLSSVARFIVEILAGMDPLLFRIDGLYYAVSSVFWGIVVSFVFAASVDWADSVE
jgi:fluoride ion exporter CrcB/FEX